MTRVGGPVVSRHLLIAAVALAATVASGPVQSAAAAARPGKGPAAVVRGAIARTGVQSSERIVLDEVVHVPGQGATRLSVSGVQSIGTGHAEALMELRLGNVGGIEERLDSTDLFLRYPASSGIHLPNGATWLDIKLSALLSQFGVSDAASLFSGASGDPTQLLSLLTASSPSGVRALGPATVHGVKVDRYRATVSLATLASHEGAGYQQLLSYLRAYLTSPTVTETIGVDRAGYARSVALTLPERIPVAGREVRVTTSLQLLLSDFGVVVTVTPPPARQIDVLSSAALKSFAAALGLHPR